MPPTAIDMTSSSAATSKLETMHTRGAAKNKIAEPVKNCIMDNIGRVSNNARGRPKANKSMSADQRHKLDAKQAASALAKEAESVFKEKAAEEKREMDEAEKQRKHEGRVAIKAKKDAERAATKKLRRSSGKLTKLPTISPNNCPKSPRLNKNLQRQRLIPLRLRKPPTIPPLSPVTNGQSIHRQY